MKRIDKIKKEPLKSNIIDFNLSHSLPIKYDTNNYPYSSEHWILHSPKISIPKIVFTNIISKDNFYKNINILKDLRFIILNENKYLSYDSIYKHYSVLRVFFNFIENNNISINSLYDIDYDILLAYCNYLQYQPNATTKYNYLKRFFIISSKYKEINLHSDVINRNFPLFKFRNDKDEINYYTKNTFDQYFLLIKTIISDYLAGVHSDEVLFVKMSYWFIAFCTGLNKTALDNFGINSYEIIINNDIKTYFILGKKNRSKKGSQVSQVSFPIKESHIFDNVINTLKSINMKYRDNFSIKEQNLLFMFQNKKNKTFHIYNGVVSKLNNSILNDYKEKLDIKDLNLSTLKIRNQWSNEMFDITKSEKMVSSMLGHENIITTLNHYMKNELSAEVLFKFNVLQKLMEEFSKNPNVSNWTEFQHLYNIKNLDIHTINENIEKGVYSTALASCFLKFENTNNKCNSYIQCFKCKNFSIIGERDLWKILSFRESLIESANENYNWLLSIISEVLSSIDHELIIKARKMLKQGRHPFWKNSLMIEHMILQYEDSNE